MSKVVAVIGLDKFVKGIQKHSQKVQNEVSSEIQKSALRIEKGAKRRVAVDTGRLKAAIRAKKTSKFQAEINARTNYAIYLEEGTRKMRAQPFLKPSVNEEKKVIMSNLNKIVKGR
ncbi:HK97-gp10 family putative phage morphogenesis protein [Listeria kieliensis]